MILVALALGVGLIGAALILSAIWRCDEITEQLEREGKGLNQLDEADFMTRWSSHWDSPFY